MSFNVTFYDMVKPVNSTAQPISTAPKWEYNCVTNSPLDIINPVFEFVLPMTDQIYKRNYCYCPILSRYYWIDKWEYNDRKWRAFGRVDPLASWKTQIGVLTPYVLRSAYAWNGEIMDNFYPVKSKWTNTIEAQANPWALSGTGCFSVGIASGGETRYYLMNQTALSLFIGCLMSNDYAEAAIGVNGLDIQAYPEAKAIVDPLQYIASVTYLPFSMPSGASITNHIRVGYVMVNGTIPANVGLRPPVLPIDRTIPYELTFTFNRPVHPKASARGVYLNAAPYTRLSLYFPPFGVIDIDTSSAMTGSTITAHVMIDKALGNGTLEISVGNQVLSRVNAKVGLPVQLSQVIAPGYGIVSGLGAVAGAVTDALTGNWGGLASGIASGIGDAIKSQIPSANTIGSVGSIDSMIGSIKLQAVFADPVDDDLTSRGRPLCEARRIDTIPGYIQCADVADNIGCTAGEMSTIKAYMESGFYYA